MILFAAVGAVIVILFAFVAFIFWRCKRTNAFCKPVRLHITDELEGELLLQSEGDADV